jgi:16S rRNA U516 pseudouridylate synthase RsuA-like enzyme
MCVCVVCVVFARCSDEFSNRLFFFFFHYHSKHIYIYSYDTSGLLLFSSSGPLTQTLLHPKHHVNKEYVAVVTGRVDEAVLRDQFTAGVTTGEGVHIAELLSVKHWGPDTDAAVDADAAADSSDTKQNDDAAVDSSDADSSTSDKKQSVAQFLQDIKTGMPPQYNQTDLKVRGYLDVFDATELSTVTMTVSEGKHRMVRRMLANCGHAVVALKRERLGAITLGDLPVGETRPLTVTELQWAEKMLKPQKKGKAYRKKKNAAADNANDNDDE